MPGTFSEWQNANLAIILGVKPVLLLSKLALCLADSEILILFISSNILSPQAKKYPSSRYVLCCSLSNDIKYLFDTCGLIFSYKYSSIGKVGVYVPGGTASYPSTVLMNCIPAIVAGVKNIYLTTPSLDSKINPAVVYAAKKCGVKKIYKTGGAHSIAALAYGTKNFEKVDKIVGPGNAFVAFAKKEVFGDVGIDMVAGPSEVSIVGDKYSDPKLIAADLIAQAEHDVYAQSILITDNKKLISSVNKSLNQQLVNLPKKKIATQSLKKFGLAIYTNKRNKISEIINIIAPEHLELCTAFNNRLIKDVKNAGSIFIGKFSPEAIGDYLAGPNHVLPTSGSARFSSGLSVNDFLKRHSLIKITKTGIERLGPSVINLAKYENLDGHANSVKIRLKKVK